MPNGITPLLWFVAVVAMIPLALWLVKRSKLVAAAPGGGTRMVSVLALSPSQRVVTVEVGHGEDRRWLVLGVTPQSISTLHTMAPQAAPDEAAGPAVPAFAQLLGNLRKPRDGSDAR